MIQIIHAERNTEIEQARTLFREYEQYIGISLCFQQFDAELAALPGKYAKPEGRLFLALQGTEAIGCIALRKLEPGVCEMKRLYVQPAYRGRQADGASLATTLITTLLREAHLAEYAKMRLDTLPSMAAAIRLYQSFGFYTIQPYYQNPHTDTLFFECDLTSTIFDKSPLAQIVPV